MSYFPMLHLVAASTLLVAPADSIALRVLSISDFHGALEPRVYAWSGGRSVGGIAALKGLMDSLARDCRCPTLRLDAGDQMQGTLASNLVYGRSSIEALNLLGLDAASLGNHDLDWGVDTLRARMREARYPWLVANVFDSATGRRPDWARPWDTVTTGPYRIAVIGYVTPATKRIVLAQRVQGLDFRGGRSVIEDVLRETRAARPDFTFLVAHEGAFCDGNTCRGEIVSLASQLDSSEVQLVIAGHTHSRVVTTVRGIPVLSAQANGTLVGVFDLLIRSDGRREWRVRTDTTYTDRVRSDSAGLALVARYRPEVERRANRVIVRLRDSLLSRGAEYPLGNLIADAQCAAAKADFGLMNRGGVRRELYPGPVTYGQLFEVQPFGNMVLRLTITAEQLKAVLERAVAGSRQTLFISGATVRYDPGRPAGERIVSILDSRGRPLDPARSYTLAVSDFIAGGGDGHSLLATLPQTDVGKVDLDALIAWLVKLPQPVRAPRGPRFIPVGP